MAGAYLGKRNRNYYSRATRSRPSLAERATHGALNGARGGFQAQPFDFEEEKKLLLAAFEDRDDDVKHQIKDEHHEEKEYMGILYYGDKKRLKYFKKRAQVPEWSLPADISQIILQPTVATKRKPLTQGLGFYEELM